MINMRKKTVREQDARPSLMVMGAFIDRLMALMSEEDVRYVKNIHAFRHDIPVELRHLNTTHTRSDLRDIRQRLFTVANKHKLATDEVVRRYISDRCVAPYKELVLASFKMLKKG